MSLYQLWEGRRVEDMTDILVIIDSQGANHTYQAGYMVKRYRHRVEIWDEHVIFVACFYNPSSVFWTTKP